MFSDYGKGDLVGFLLFQQLQRNDEVNACRRKAAESSAAHRCAAAAEASKPHSADTLVFDGSQHQPATSVEGSCGAIPRKDVDPELVLD